MKNRNTGEATVQWEELYKIISRGGHFEVPSKRQGVIEERISRLNKNLRGITGIEDNPIRKVREGIKKIYSAEFLVKDEAPQLNQLIQDQERDMSGY